MSKLLFRSHHNSAAPGEIEAEIARDIENERIIQEGADNLITNGLATPKALCLSPNGKPTFKTGWIILGIAGTMKALEGKGLLNLNRANNPGS